jgi:glycosyltransferase involved in cell wall biosynthesis
MPTRKLVVIGTGPEEERLRARCTPNISMLGYQSDEVLRDYMRRALAFLFAAPEDFGIVMAEAQACGTPVIALGRGGAMEIVRGLENVEPTGAFFDAPEPASVCDAVGALEQHALRITPARCRVNAERFMPEVFRAAFKARVDEAVAHYGNGRSRQPKAIAADVST